MDKRQIAVLTLCVFALACGREAANDPGAGNAAAAAAPETAPPNTGGGEFLGQPTGHWVDQIAAGADAGERTRAVAALASIGPGDEGVTEALIGALADPEALVKTGANRTLINFGSPIAADLIDALQSSPDAAIRTGVAPILGNWSDEAAVNAALCEALLEDDDPNVRAAAARGLTVGGVKSVAAVPDLIRALEDESAEVRQFAALALGRIGSGAVDAIPALEAAEQDSERAVASAARGALRQVRR